MANINHVLYSGSNKIISRLCTTVNWLIDHGGGGGSNIAVDTILDDGVNIADITVDNTLYHLFAPEGGGGGGNGYKETVLFSSSTELDTYDLSDSLDNYDLILFVGAWSVGSTGVIFSNAYTVKELLSDMTSSTQYCISNDSRTLYFYVNSTTQVKRGTWHNNMFMREIRGIKFSGSGGCMSVVALDTEKRMAWNTSYELSDSLNNYELVLIQMYYTGDNYQFTGDRILKVSDLLGNDHGQRVWIDGGNNDRALYLQIIDDTHYQIVGGNSSNGIHGIYGIKSSSGGGKPEYTQLYKSTTAVRGDISLSDDLLNYDAVELIYGFQTTDEARCSMQFKVDYFVDSFPYATSGLSLNALLSPYGTYYVRVTIGQNNNSAALHIWNDDNNVCGIYEVYGIKY